MTTKYVLNRGCLRWNRPRLMLFLAETFYPNMAVITTAAMYPLADGKISLVKGKITDYGTDHGLHHTIAANKDWSDMQEDLGLVFDYIDEIADNNSSKLELTGVPISIPKGHGTKAPRTGRVTSVKLIAEGGLLFRAEYESDDYAHHFRGRTKLHSAPETDWFEEGESQNHTMYFTGKEYPRGSEVDVEILGSGTEGDAIEWSGPGTDLIR